MKTVELERINGWWHLTYKVNGKVIREENYSAYVNAENRAHYFVYKDYRCKIIVKKSVW